MKFLSDVDLDKNNAVALALDVQSSAPGSPVTGQIYYDSTLKSFRFYDGTAWQSFSDLDVAYWMAI